LWKQQALFIVVPGKGMLRYDLASKKITEYKNVPGDLGTLSVNFLRKFYVDDSDNLWLGTEGGGLSKLDLKQRKFNCYPAGVYNIPNPANMMVKSLYARGTKIYAGTFSKGLYIIDTITNEASVVNILKKSTQDNDAPITAMLNDSRNRIWIGCGNYIGFIHAATGQFEKFDTIDAKNGFIYSIYEHSPDTLLIGTYKRVFRVVVDKNHNVHVDKENVFNNPEITGLIQSIVKGPGNSVYIGTIEHGFKKCVVQGDNLVIKAQGMSNTGVRHFYNDVVNQIMWIATDNGLLAYNDSTGEYSLFDERQGLSNGHIYAILPESDNVLWISNNKGLNRIRFDKNELGEVRITTVKQFNQKSGLQSNEFNSGAYFAYNRKHLMFGGVSGVNWFNTENVVSNHHIPQVVLTGLMVNEKRYLTPIDYPFLKKLELPYYNNSVYLNYAALEFTNPVLNKYVYKMEGGENIWVEGSNEVRFSNLEPGSYKFLVKAANNDGVWSDEQLLLEIKIIPPFWGTWWFKTLMAVLLTMAMIGLGHYLVKRSVRKKTRELEMQQVLNEERNRISRDMHDEMGTGLTKISLLTEVARHINQQDRDKSLQTLKDISVTSRGLTQKMGEIIWMLSPVNDTLDSLAAYLKEYVYNITDSLNIDVVTDFPENIPAIKLSHDKRRQLLLVTKEALHNALKHAAATQISFSMDIHKHGFLLMMNDNGKGLTNETSEKTGNGLKNMAWRMEQIGGVFKIESESGNGTTVIYGIQDL
jgi:signal transduction histidine kinase